MSGPMRPEVLFPGGFRSGDLLQAGLLAILHQRHGSHRLRALTQANIRLLEDRSIRGV